MNSKITLAVLVSLSFGVGAANAESLSTADGVTYDNISMKRVDPDGLYIEYTPNGGGLGMSKIKFYRLSEDQRKQFGYNEAKARDYEAQNAKAMESWRAETIRTEQEARARMASRQAELNQEEALKNARILAEAQLIQAQAELARATGGGENYGTLGDAGIALAIPQTARPTPPMTHYAPIARPFEGDDSRRPHFPPTPQNGSVR